MFFPGRGLLRTAPICLGLAYTANDRTGVISEAPFVPQSQNAAFSCQQGSPNEWSYPSENEPTIRTCE